MHLSFVSIRSICKPYHSSVQSRSNEQELATRIGDLLNVVVAANDGLPQHVCDRCMRRVKTLERAAEDLVDLVMVNVSFVVGGLCFHTSKQQAEQSTA